MALEKRNTTRFIARVGTWVASAISFVLEILKSFLNIKEGDGLLTKGMKTADLIVRRVVYLAADYGLAIVAVAIVVAMKASGFSFIQAFLALWVFDFVAAGTFVVFYEKTGKDLSLGEDFRRATDVVSNKSWLAGFLVTLGVIFLAIVWTGPEKIITFFRKEIRTIPRVTAVLLVLTAIQAVIWAVIYSSGYDLVVKLF